MSNKDNKEQKGLAVDYLKKHGKAGTVIVRRKRKPVEIVKSYGRYTKGQILKMPHVTWAEELIEKGIAKEYVAPKKK